MAFRIPIFKTVHFPAVTGKPESDIKEGTDRELSSSFPVFTFAFVLVLRVAINLRVLCKRNCPLAQSNHQRLIEYLIKHLSLVCILDSMFWACEVVTKHTTNLFQIYPTLQMVISFLWDAVLCMQPISFVILYVYLILPLGKCKKSLLVGVLFKAWSYSMFVSIPPVIFSNNPLIMESMWSVKLYKDVRFFFFYVIAMMFWTGACIKVSNPRLRGYTVALIIVWTLTFFLPHLKWVFEGARTAEDDMQWIYDALFVSDKVGFWDWVQFLIFLMVLLFFGFMPVTFMSLTEEKLDWKWLIVPRKQVNHRTDDVEEQKYRQGEQCKGTSKQNVLEEWELPEMQNLEISRRLRDAQAESEGSDASVKYSHFEVTADVHPQSNTNVAKK